MDGWTFEKKVLEELNKLTEEDVKRIRQEIDLHHDYEIDENGVSHIVEKNLDTLPEDNVKKVMSDIDGIVPKITNDESHISNFDSKVRNSENSEFQTASKGEMKVYVQDEYFTDIVNRTGDKTKAIRKAA